MLILSVIVTLEILSVSCNPEAEYQIFKGFDLKAWEETTETTSPRYPIKLKIRRRPRTTAEPVQQTNTDKFLQEFLDIVNATTEAVSLGIESMTIRPVKNTKSACPENEKPSNIGPYEVPSQRDLVLLTQKTLHRIYGSYHEKIMVFLEDIKKVTRATEQVEKKCGGHKKIYRKCVKHVSSKCEIITKRLTSALEQQRQDVLAFGQNNICSLEEMKEDPVKLVKMIASEEASLEFALPGFLRLLNSCSAYCLSPLTDDKFKAVRPSRRLTDTDIVVRHFLTPKNYKRLLNGRLLRRHN